MGLVWSSRYTISIVSIRLVLCQEFKADSVLKRTETGFCRVMIFQQGGYIQKHIPVKNLQYCVDYIDVDYGVMAWVSFYHNTVMELNCWHNDVNRGIIDIKEKCF